MRQTPTSATLNAPEPVSPWPTVGQSGGASAVNGFLASLGTTVVRWMDSLTHHL